MIERPFETVRLDVSDAIATITLDRPQRRNAIGPRMTNELLYALADCFGEAGVRCVVLTGEGSVFCAGGDFAEISVGSPSLTLPSRGDFADLLLALVNSPKPVIARVNGPAMGGGLGLVAACSLAVASSSATFGTPEVKVGLFPMMIIAVLARVLARKQFLEMALLGSTFSADDAMRLGLINRVTTPDALDHDVWQLAHDVADKSAVAVRLGLEAMAAQQDMPLAAALPMLSVRLQACLATDDAREGLTAFLEKRNPKWAGH